MWKKPTGSSICFSSQSEGQPSHILFVKSFCKEDIVYFVKIWYSYKEKAI